MGLVSTPGPVIEITEEGREAARGLLAWARPRLTDEKRAAGIGQEDFPSLLCWLLMQDPYEPLDRDEAPSSSVRKLLETEGKSAGARLNSMSVYQQFLYWARFLGFVQWTKSDKITRVIPVPTASVHWAISVAGFAPGSVTPAGTFIGKIAEACPVLDGGTTRERVERRLDTGTYGAGVSVSPTLGLALLTLEASGTISLLSTSDAPTNLTLFPSSRGRLQTFSDVGVV